MSSRSRLASSAMARRSRKGPRIRSLPRKDVLHAVFKIVQRQILVYGADPQVHGLGDGEAAIAASANPDLPLVGPEVAGEDFDQSGLAGAVIPHNSGDRALPHMERDAVEDLDLSKGFENLVDGKDILFHIHIHYSDCQKAMFLFPIIAVCQRKFKLTDKINR